MSEMSTKTLPTHLQKEDTCYLLQRTMSCDPCRHSTTTSDCLRSIGQNANPLGFHEEKANVTCCVPPKLADRPRFTQAWDSRTDAHSLVDQVEYEMLTLHASTIVRNKESGAVRLTALAVS